MSRNVGDERLSAVRTQLPLCANIFDFSLGGTSPISVDSAIHLEEFIAVKLPQISRPFNDSHFQASNLDRIKILC